MSTSLVDLDLRSYIDFCAAYIQLTVKGRDYKEGLIFVLTGSTGIKIVGPYSMFNMY